MIFPNSPEPYLYLTLGVASGFALGVAFVTRAARRYTRMNVGHVIRTMTSGSELPPEVEAAADMAAENEDLKMVFVVRTDLKMGAGKIAAQCAHAAVKNYEASAENAPHYLIAWREQGQTKITLKGDSQEHLEILQQTARSLGLVAEVIRDAGRTQIARGSMTVLGIGPAPKQLIDQVTGNLKLMH